MLSLSDLRQIHPLPQMMRELYVCIDDGWTLCGSPITLPYPPEARASGYTGKITDPLVYTTTFDIPEDFDKERILLHFGAVDQTAEIYVNERPIGRHEGGYLPFSFDITSAIYKRTGNRLKVVAHDTLSHFYPYGKQTTKPGGMWYTQVSGIWQCVWLENVPHAYVKDLKLTPDTEGVNVQFSYDFTDKQKDVRYTLSVQTDTAESFSYSGVASGSSFCLSIRETSLPKLLWTPDTPYLYDLTLYVGEDVLHSYFALRTITIERHDGINRLCLNGKPVFLHGVLEQGYFPDGIYTTGDTTSYELDILRLKELGFNCMRKHIKVEPDAFYYACDNMGMLVIQDMVNSGSYHYLRDTVLPNLGFTQRKDQRKDKRDKKRRAFFIRHCRETLGVLYNHPSVIIYTIFNEGWGQFDSDHVYTLLKKEDPTRLYNSTSGWFAQEKSDFDSLHVYFKTKTLTPGDRPMLLSECGGYTYLPDGYRQKKVYGYGKTKSPAALTDKIILLYEKMILPAIPQGLCGCIYTQAYDVEEERNGLYTYDRIVCKVEAERMRALAARILSAMP